MRIGINSFGILRACIHGTSKPPRYTSDLEHVMARLRVRRTWWIMGQAEAPLFRVLARKWRPIDRRERRMTPFQLALAAAEAPKPTRSSFGPKKREVAVADKAKKSARIWNPWMMTR
jgi:hypothetical protein